MKIFELIIKDFSKNICQNYFFINEAPKNLLIVDYYYQNKKLPTDNENKIFYENTIRTEKEAQYTVTDESFGIGGKSLYAEKIKMYDTDNLTKDEAEYLASYINDDIFLDCIYFTNKKQIQQYAKNNKYLINDFDFNKEGYYTIIENYDRECECEYDDDVIVIDINSLETWFKYNWLYILENTDKEEFLNMFENSY